MITKTNRGSDSGGWILSLDGAMHADVPQQFELSPVPLSVCPTVETHSMINLLFFHAPAYTQVVKQQTKGKLQQATVEDTKVTTKTILLPRV